MAHRLQKQIIAWVFCYLAAMGIIFFCQDQEATRHARSLITGAKVSTDLRQDNSVKTDANGCSINVAMPKPTGFLNSRSFYMILSLLCSFTFSGGILFIHHKAHQKKVRGVKRISQRLLTRMPELSDTHHESTALVARNRAIAEAIMAEANKGRTTINA